MNDLEQLQVHTRTTIRNLALLRTAFTHRSYLNETRVDEKGNTLEHNERLEFLGDAVLELVVTQYLYTTYPDKPEGELTAVRAALVNTVSISDAAKEYHMNDFLLLSKGEARDTGRARDVILANTFESFLGALYLDKGYAAAQEFISRALLGKTKDIVDKKLWRDPKSRFQEVAQERIGTTPHYQILRDEGPDHDKQFVAGIFIGKEKIAEGMGKSKQEAETAAAKNGLVAKGW